MGTSSNKFYKIWLYMLIVLKYPLNKDDQEIAKITKFLEDDFNFCPECFQADCSKLVHEIDFTEDFTGSLNNLFGVKLTRYGLLKSNAVKIVIKYLANQEKFDCILGSYCKNKAKAKCKVIETKEAYTRLEELFFEKSRIDGCQYCPAETVDKFTVTIAGGFSKFSTWVQMNVNIQPLILPILDMHKFPVPKFYGACGFTLYESYEGLPLIHYYTRPFRFKAKLATQLLEAAFKFTEGFDGFKLYLTDINSDNIVYNEETERVVFVDLDNIIVVDSLYKPNSSIPQWDRGHRHDFIECDGCFAYVPLEICSHRESDLNVFSICQLLREDLYGDVTKGFLHPIPGDIKNAHPEVIRALDACVRCEGDYCENRFESAKQLLNLFRKIASE